MKLMLCWGITVSHTLNYMFHWGRINTGTRQARNMEPLCFPDVFLGEICISTGNVLSRRFLHSCSRWFFNQAWDWHQILCVVRWVNHSGIYTLEWHMVACLLLKPRGYSADFFVHVDNLVGRFNLFYKIFYILIVGTDDYSIFFLEYDNSAWFLSQDRRAPFYACYPFFQFSHLCVVGHAESRRAWFLRLCWLRYD